LLSLKRFKRFLTPLVVLVYNFRDIVVPSDRITVDPDIRWSLPFSWYDKSIYNSDFL